MSKPLAPFPPHLPRKVFFSIICTFIKKTEKHIHSLVACISSISLMCSSKKKTNTAEHQGSILEIWIIGSISPTLFKQQAHLRSSGFGPHFQPAHLEEASVHEGCPWQEFIEGLLNFRQGNLGSLVVVWNKKPKRFLPTLTVAVLLFLHIELDSGQVWAIAKNNNYLVSTCSVLNIMLNAIYTSSL